MSDTAATDHSALDQRITAALQQYWGFDALRPLQREAIEAGIEQRDSVVVLPTGGGKSLCYQVPPLIAGRLDVVISPLIALMKDQVDALRQCGYPAAAVHSHLSEAEREQIRQGLREGGYRLLFVTPERLLTEPFLDFLDRQQVRSFAIDEAHCISQWGHDFRPEYRQLARLKQRFPDASVHAYTATATQRVQQDIVTQLDLQSPHMVIGTFDRPNLVYRVLPAQDLHGQVLEIVRRHPGEAVIVYCISRKDTEAMAAHLQAHGIRAAYYHAGMEKPERRQVQDDFAAERTEVVAATVAFGMGIDRSNVRCVIHAAMPKSIEHYQQETGRAGRDGLEAECVLLYSGSDAMRWEGLIERSAEQAEQPEQVTAAQLELLRHMRGLCNTLQCRHRALSQYFGQDYPHDNCGACDVCLGEVEGMAESTTIAQKILSCVYRLGRPYGARYLVQVLRGAKTQDIQNRGHDQVSTYGLLRDMPEKKLQHLVYQLVDLGLLAREEGEFPTLWLTEDAGPVLRGEREVQLIDPRTGQAKRSRADTDAWEGVDTALFEQLRALRRETAQQAGVPPYVVFGDAVLRELARLRPSTLDAMRAVRGVGEKKLEAYGQPFLEKIIAYCDEQDVAMDARSAAPAPTDDAESSGEKRANPRKEQAMQLFAEGRPVEQVADMTGRAMSTTWGYLEQYIQEQQPARIDAWVSDELYQTVVQAATTLAADRLRPIYQHLNGDVPYEHIRIILAHHRVTHGSQ